MIEVSGLQLLKIKLHTSLGKIFRFVLNRLFQKESISKDYVIMFIYGILNHFIVCKPLELLNSINCSEVIRLTLLLRFVISLIKKERDFNLVLSFDYNSFLFFHFKRNFVFLFLIVRSGFTRQRTQNNTTQETINILEVLIRHIIDRTIIENDNFVKESVELPKSKTFKAEYS